MREIAYAAGAVRRGFASVAAARGRSSGKASSSGSVRVADLIDSAAATHPLKDAFKFFETTTSRVMVWANRDVKLFSDAIACGMDELGYKSGDKVAVWMPFGSPEFLAIALGAARVGVTIAPIAPPSDKLAADIAPVVSALDSNAPRGFVFWHEYVTPLPEDFVWNAEDDGINPLTERLFPAIREDAIGLRGVTRLTGREFCSARFPSVKHVIHTGQRHWRQLVQLRSVMRFDCPPPPSADGVDASASFLLGTGAGGDLTESFSQGDLCAKAEQLGKKLGLSGDHALKSGKLVVPTQASAAAVVQGAVCGLSTGSLCVFPSYSSTLADAQNVANAELATLQQ